MGVNTGWGIHGVYVGYSGSIHGIFICIGYVSGMYRVCIGNVQKHIGCKKSSPKWFSTKPGNGQNEQKNENVCEVLRAYFKKMQLFCSKICVFHLFSVILRVFENSYTITNTHDNNTPHITISKIFDFSHPKQGGGICAIVFQKPA